MSALVLPRHPGKYLALASGQQDLCLPLFEQEGIERALDTQLPVAAPAEEWSLRSDSNHKGEGIATVISYSIPSGRYRALVEPRPVQLPLGEEVRDFESFEKPC